MIYHTSNYIEIAITKDMIELARKRADDIGRLKNSVSKGEHVIYGTLFEVMIQKFTGCDYIGDYNYDLFYKGKRLEAKVKPCRKMPTIDYACTVYTFNDKQDTDWYVFGRILRDMSKGWILGYIEKDLFFKKCHFTPEGIKEGGTLTTQAPAWTMDIKDLNPFPGSKVNVGILTW